MTLFALCAGVSDYSQWRNIGWDTPDLPYSIKNAEDFARILIDNFGTTPENIGIQRDSWCSSGNFLSAIDDLIRKAQPGDSLCVFFSGHGTRLQGSATGSGDASHSNLWYDALLPHAGSPVTDYDFAVLTERLAADKVSLTVVLDTAYVGGIRPVAGAPQPVGIALSQGMENDFISYCHTLVPIGLGLQNPLAVMAGNTSAIRKENGRLIIEFAENGYRVDGAKALVLNACAPDEIAWQINDSTVPDLRNSVFVAAWKAVLANANGPVSMSWQDLLTALRTESDKLMTRNIRRMASYAKLTQVPQMVGSSARVSQRVFSSNAAGVSG